MPVIRKFAIQGHAVPKRVYTARGLEGALDPDVMTQSSVYYDGEHGDSLHEAFDDVRLFRCRDCGTIVYEDERESHLCDEDDSFPDA